MPQCVIVIQLLFLFSSEIEEELKKLGDIEGHFLSIEQNTQTDETPEIIPTRLSQKRIAEVTDEDATEISQPMKEKIENCPVCHFCGTLMAKQKRDVKSYKSIHRQGCKKFQSSFDMKQRECFLCDAKIKVGHSVDIHFAAKHPEKIQCEHTELIEESKPVNPKPKRMKNCPNLPVIFVDGKPQIIETFPVEDSNSDSNRRFPRILAKSKTRMKPKKNIELSLEASEKFCLGYNEQVAIIDEDVNVNEL